MPPLPESERIAEQIVAEWRDGYEPPLLSDEAPALVKAIAAVLAKEKAAEREACARVTDAYASETTDYCRLHAASWIGKMIRARSLPEGGRE